MKIPPELRKKYENARHPMYNRIKKFRLRKSYIVRPDKVKLSKSITQTLKSKIHTFCNQGNTYVKPQFSVKDVLNKIGDDPICYLTGRKIDLTDSASYQLDHIIPKIKGGDNSLSNLQITCKDANMAKAHMSLDEFYSLCIEVVRYNGLKV